MLFSCKFVDTLSIIYFKVVLSHMWVRLIVHIHLYLRALYTPSYAIVFRNFKNSKIVSLTIACEPYDCAHCCTRVWRVCSHTRNNTFVHSFMLIDYPNLLYFSMYIVTVSFELICNVLWALFIVILKLLNKVHCIIATSLI